MDVNVIKPQGFCLGVAKALQIVDEAINDITIPRPIYLLGRIIHNDIVVNKIKAKGVIVLDDKNKTRLEQLQEIKTGSVIFSAHGVPPIYYEIAKSKNIHIIDATCKHVLKIQNNIKHFLANGYDIIYIGTNGHPESIGVLGISEQIHLVTSEADIDNLTINSDKIYATNQTTLSIFDLKDIKEKLLNKYPNIQYDDKICGATSVRQQAMAKQPKADLCIIVGDKNSSNTKKLAKVSSTIANIETILISTLEELDVNILKNKKTVNISSGASTPEEITNEVIAFLRLYE